MDTQDWLLILTSVVAFVSTATASWLGFLRYRLKAKTELRVQESAQAEIDVRLSSLFSDLVRVANGRGEGYFSEECAKRLFESTAIGDKDFEDLDALRAKIRTACTGNLPVGWAAQNGAITSIAVLGATYPILKEPARAAISSLGSFIEAEAEEAMKVLSRGSSAAAG